MQSTRGPLDPQRVRGLLEAQPGLSLFQAEVADLVVTGGRVAGVVTQATANAYAKFMDSVMFAGHSGKSIAGLYAVGNDMHSIMGGVYPAPGITVGPGLVFAYIAIRHMTRENPLNVH